MSRRGQIRARYQPSPEHKTHPGPWGAPKWHPREPALTVCPTDLALDEVERWLASALGDSECWDRRSDVAESEGQRLPAYLYWYSRNRFFIGQRLQRRGQAAVAYSYKGYPVDDADVPPPVARHFAKLGLLDEQRLATWRRAFRRKHGAKG